MSYDSPWKEGICRYFRQFLEFFFPEVAAEVDWEAGWDLLDTELRQITREAETGERRADTLVRVRRRQGDLALVLIHVEVQNQVDADFPQRMLVYHYRIFDYYRLPVCSLAILGDSAGDWRPASYRHSLWGCQLQLDFPIVKLTDFKGRVEELSQDPNPFGLIVAAHLEAQATRPDTPRRRHAKLRLVRRLYQRGATKEEVLELFRLIDWILELSGQNDGQFLQDLAEYEQEVCMTYITSVERHGIEIGLQQGREEGRLAGLREATLKILSRRFGPPSEELVARFQAITEPARLDDLVVAAASEPSWEAFLSVLAGPEG
ncbi:MAG: transposase [Candidatus Eremiobacterota bacterium]